MIALPDSDDGASDLDTPLEIRIRARPAANCRVTRKRPAAQQADDADTAMTNNVIVPGKQPKVARHPGQPVKAFMATLIATVAVVYEWPTDATRASRTHPAFWEIDSPPRLSLRLDPDKISYKNFDLETGWNLSTQWRLVLDTYIAALPRPTVILGCPPCTPFSSLMYSNWWKMAVDK